MSRRKRIISAIVFALIFLGISKYSGIIRMDEDRTEPIVRVFGPGNDPETCFRRAKRAFLRMEPDITILAEFVAKTKSRDATYYPEDTQYINAEATDIERQAWAKIEPTLYSPLNIHQNEDGHVIAGLFRFFHCNKSVADWTSVRFNIGGAIAPDDSMFRSSAALFAYYPDGIPNDLRCDTAWKARSKDVEHVAICEKAINEHWIWRAENFQVPKSKLQTDRPEE